MRLDIRHLGASLAREDNPLPAKLDADESRCQALYLSSHRRKPLLDWAPRQRRKAGNKTGPTTQN